MLDILLTCTTLIAPSIVPQALHAGVPVRLATAVALVESGCNPYTTRPLGPDGLPLSSATGMFQVLSFWTRTPLAYHCGGRDLTQHTVNVCYGVHILRHYYVKCRGSWPCALRRYSGQAPGYVQNVRKWLRRLDAGGRG